MKIVPKRFRQMSILPYTIPIAGSAVGAGMAYAYKKYANAATQTFGSIGTQTGVSGVSNQYDSRVMYRKRRRRRGRRAAKYRRRSRKYTRKILKVIRNSVGTKTVLVNNSLGDNWYDQNQHLQYVHLYGASGANAGNEIGTRDVYEIMYNDSQTNEASEKINFKTGVLDLTYSNTGEVPLEVDVYYLVYTKTIKSKLNLTTMVADATNAQQAAGSASSIVPSARGWTPWQLPTLLSAGVKVIKKTKHFVPVGGYFTEFWKDTKPKQLNLNDVWDGTSQQFCLGGKTLTCLIISKKVTGMTDDTIAKLSIGVTKTYTYKVIGDNADKDAYFAGI